MAPSPIEDIGVGSEFGVATAINDAGHAVGNTGPMAKRVALRILELLHSGAITPALTA